MFPVDTFILVAGILLLLGITSSKLSMRLGIPVLVLFLLLGMLAGSEGIGGLEFEDYEVAHGIGTIALALILFDGGLSTSMSAVQLAWKPSVLLATWGVLVTAVITGIAASTILGITWMEGMLLGSIVGSTDAAAVFSVLRSGGISLPRRISAVLEVESASNDPMAIFLTIGCIELLLGNVQPGPALLGLFASQILLGAVCGVLGGYTAVWVTNRMELSTSGLYPILVTSFCLLTYGVTAWLGGSGFLAVYLAGLVLGNRALVFQSGIRRFHDAMAWLAQIVMFVVLGLLCFPSRLIEVAGNALLIALVLIFLARPIAVLLSVLPFRFSWQELTFMSWVGLKGAVPITLATFPLMLGTADNNLQAPLLFNVIFFIVVVSAAFQGTSLAPVARLLGLERPAEPDPPFTLEISSLRHVEGDIVDYSVGRHSRAAGRLVRDLALPDGAVIALVARGDRVVPPQGNTRIHEGDHVILVLRPGIQPLVNQVFGRNAEDRGVIPSTVEFPLRADRTIGEIQEFYTLELDGPRDRTLAEVMKQELGKNSPEVGDSIQVGAILLRVQRVDGAGNIERVGMSILPEHTSNSSDQVG